MFVFNNLLATALVVSVATLSVAAPTPSEKSSPSSIKDTLALSSSYSVVDQCDCPAAAVSWVIIDGQCTCEYPSAKAPQVKEKRFQFPPACAATTHCTNGDRLIYTSIPNSCFCWQPSRNRPPSKRAVASLEAPDEKKLAPQVKEERDVFQPACVATTHCTNGDRLIYTDVPNSCFCWQPSKNRPPSKRAVISLEAQNNNEKAQQIKEKRKVPDCAATTHCTNGDRLIYTDVPNSCFCWQPSRNRPPSERAVTPLEEEDHKEARHVTSNDFDDDDELSEVGE
ncbi:hypothetical protein G7Y79_00031g065880 [Physcia stellaris]|nr:hypothetical protein G7Y79_00031g065880 [Physcia stellaris]